MKNSTKFLDDIMKNSIHQYLVIDVTDKPTLDDWWIFEEECLGEHFGMDRERNSGWWATYFVSEVSTLAINNFIILEIKVVGGEYVLEYLGEARRVEDFDEPYEAILIIPFSEIYNKYLLKPLPETLGWLTSDEISIDASTLEEIRCSALSQSSAETLVKAIEEQPKDFDVKKGCAGYFRLSK